MQLRFLFGLLLLLPQCSSQTCNYVGLVKCFIKILDDWAWTLYELKDNVVTITQEQCQHLHQLDRCIKDDIPEPHQCSHSEIVETSNTVSDLLTHRKGSGTFLRSYYLLTYACSPEGQDILSNHRTCLKSEKIGEMTISAGTYLSENIVDKETDEDICEKINEKLQAYIGAMTGICDKTEAAQLMCNSLTTMIQGLHADKLGENCKLDCNIVVEPEEKDDEMEPNVAAEHNALGAITDANNIGNVVTILCTILAYIAIQF
ncbi:unnamed protein product [Auanema sp. JU1783]|nr:unnamed protein product [Auanema sp. JU1783]